MDQQSVDKDFFRSRVRRWSWRFGGGEVVDQQSVDKDGLATLVSELLHTHTPNLPDADEKRSPPGLSWMSLMFLMSIIIISPLGFAFCCTSFGPQIESGSVNVKTKLGPDCPSLSG